jgi:hypothetical protein
VRNVTLYNKFERFGIIIKNSCGFLINKRENFAFFDVGNNFCFHPKVIKNVPR